MAMKKGFDNEKYLEEQTEAILNRVRKFDSKVILPARKSAIEARDKGKGNNGFFVEPLSNWKTGQ